MTVPPLRLAGTRSRLAGLTAVAASTLLVLSHLLAPPAASALTSPHAGTLAPLTVPEPVTPVTANATHFDGLGQPYGGCGLPQSELESQDFVALNVYDTPGDYTFYPRPIPPDQASRIGIWDNGRNCGRWVQVSIGDLCTGINDGAPNQAFCRNGSWVSDRYNGAVLTMLVADSCGDSNGWCRDDPYHLDLAKASVNRFVKDGVPVGDLQPDHWNNRRVQWQFIPAPNYTGDIQIGFLQGAQQWWPAISVSRLANGIHGVEFFANGAWQAAQPNSDMGQSYIIGGTTTGGTQFQIRVRDADGQLINDGRVYSFTLPASCGSQCSVPYTRISYTTSDGTGEPTASPTAPASPTASPTVPPPGGCAASVAVTGAWSGGFQVDVRVTNTGSTAIAGWRVGFTFPGAQQVASSWNATVTQSGQQVSATNAGFNGAVAAGGSTAWGMIVNGPDQVPVNPTCTTT